MDESNERERAKNEIRKLFRESVGAPPANDQMMAPTKLQAARRRVNASFGQALLVLALVPFVACLSPHLDATWGLIFGGYGLTLLAVGAFYVDRANAPDKALMKDW